MPWYEYEGHTPGGTLITGRLEAVNNDMARLELSQMKIELKELRTAAPSRTPPAALNADELIFFNQQLAGLAKAGLALDEGLAQLARDVQSLRLRVWIEGLVEDLRRGMPIDQALKAREAGLPVLYSQVVRAGIATGRLPAVLLGLNQHLQAAGTTRRIVWEAATYPLVLGLLGLTIVSFFFMAVVPHFRGIFEDFNTRLPSLTVMTLAVAENFQVVLTILAALAGGAVLFWWLMWFTPGGRHLRERLVLLLPILGSVHRSSLIARFLRAVSLSVETGVPLPQAIRLSSDATGSAALTADADYLADQIEQGRPILEANRSTRVIPPLFGYCVEAATVRDNLPAALGELARAYEDRVLHGQGILRVFLLPCFIVLVGGLIGLAVIAMFLPLVTLINCVSGGG